jgi:hypothetical protein
MKGNDSQTGDCQFRYSDKINNNNIDDVIVRLRVEVISYSLSSLKCSCPLQYYSTILIVIDR